MVSEPYSVQRRPAGGMKQKAEAGRLGDSPNSPTQLVADDAGGSKLVMCADREALRTACHHFGGVALSFASGGCPCLMSTASIPSMISSWILTSVVYAISRSFRC